jgi:hypothetical protein
MPKPPTVIEKPYLTYLQRKTGVSQLNKLHLKKTFSVLFICGNARKEK